MSESAYVSGPMSNKVAFNFPLFDEVSAAWRALGNTAISPAERDREWLIEEQGADAKPENFPGYDTGDVAAYSAATNFSYAKALAWDLNAVSQQDAIVMLPEWPLSRGALAERFMAELCGKKVYIAVPKDGGGYDFVLDPEQTRITLHVQTENGWADADVTATKEPEVMAPIPGA